MFNRYIIPHESVEFKFINFKHRPILPCKAKMQYRLRPTSQSSKQILPFDFYSQSCIYYCHTMTYHSFQHRVGYSLLVPEGLTLKLSGYIGIIFYPLEVVDRYRDPQPQVCKIFLHNVQFVAKRMSV